MKLNADAPPLQFRLPESRLGGQSQNYQNRLEFGAVSQRLIPAGERSGLLTRIATPGKRFVVHANDKLTASVDLETAIRTCGELA
jgi:hypothetical protein